MPERGDVDAETTDAIDAFVCDWLSENGVPGASIALVTAEESLYTRGTARGTSARTTRRRRGRCTGSAPSRSR